MPMNYSSRKHCSWIRLRTVTLGDAVLKTGLILFLMEKGVQTKGGITQEKEPLEDNDYACESCAAVTPQKIYPAGPRRERIVA